MAVRRKPPIPFLLFVYLTGSFHSISLLKTDIASELVRVTFGTATQPKGIVHLKHTNRPRLDS